MRNTIDLNDMSTIQTPSDIIEAIRLTFDPELGLHETSAALIRLTLKDKAVELNCSREVNTLLDEYYANFDKCNFKSQILQKFDTDRYGRPLTTINNFILVMENDPAFADLKYNEFAMRYEKQEDDGTIRLWTDTDDSGARAYIETEYGIHSQAKYADAIACHFSKHRYHPIKQIIEKLKWDGEPRIENILTKWMGAEDTPYTREVSRLIFAGGIQRIYRPGCKFEDMAVLIGKQGGGKSSFIRWLAIKDDLFCELKTIDGKEAVEAINGAWITEVSELLALTKTKEQEAVKAFLSTCTDKYRPAYGRRTVEIPRTCVFVGSSNREQFITDKTGGRRFYPVICNTVGYDLFDREAECREYIKQCWAEAFVKRDTPFMQPFADRRLKSEIEEQQSTAAEDDYRVGVIESYLADTSHDQVCFGMLWEDALGNDMSKATKSDQTQIGMIMRNMPGWKRYNHQIRFGKYGLQKHWKRIKEQIAPTYDTPNDDFPF